MRYVIQSTDSHNHSIHPWKVVDRSLNIAGGKAASLARLESYGFTVPEWFVISPSIFFDGLSDQDKEEYRHLQASSILQGKELQSLHNLIERFVGTADFLNELYESISSLGGDYFAVRSSGLDEDGSKHSFAGMMESFLYVPGGDIIARIKDVWRSAFAARIVAYRKERGLVLLPVLPAVIVQKMIEPEAAGVAFSRDPATGEPVFSIAATYGLAQGLVSGQMEADTYIVRDGGIEKHLVKKLTALRFDVEKGYGTTFASVDELSARKAALSDAQIKTVANLTKKAEELFGCPQDIEWAIAQDRLYVLQSRPVTTMSNVVRTEQQELTIFDNSNIGESYSGVTTPLTFTFARRAYEAVYRQFLMLMLVPERRLTANEHVFSNMIACVRGHIYYNLINWYRVLAMLPGYTLNRSFMEQMMGVKTALPEEVKVRQAKKSAPLNLLADGLAALFSLAGLVINYILLKRKIASFYQRLTCALAPVELAEMSLDDLHAYYRKLEEQLLHKWDAPIINDFFAMINFGVLRKLTCAWCQDTNGSLGNDLISGTGNIVSAEPARRIKQMARLAAQDKELTSLLLNGSQEDVERHILRFPEFKRLYEEYLNKFGDRCLGELKLESQTLVEEALPLLRSVGQLSRRMLAGERTARRAGTLIRRRAEQQAYQAIGHNLLKRALFALVLHNTRQTVRNRENLRFERTRVFGRVRKVMLQIGRRLTEQGLLADSRDIFYLELEDIRNYLSGTSGGTSTTTSFKELVLLRKSEFNLYSLDKELPDRIEMRGPINPTVISNTLPQAASPATAERSQLKGLGSSPGKVKGRVRLVADPKEAVLEAGDILVAKRTDPGWVTLFPAAAGLLVEHGSLLSHVAIVARELGLPAIVSIPQLTEVLRNGDLVEMDGTTGVVQRLSQLPLEASCEANCEAI